MALPSGLEGTLSSLAGNITKILEAVLIFAVAALTGAFIRGWMRRSISPKLPMHIYKPLENFIFYSIIFTGSIAALRPFGLNLGSLVVAGGLASIVIGLAAQDTLGDVISGFFLLIEQPLRVGDPVQIENIAGEVVDVRVLSTLIRTWDGQLVRIPNKNVFNNIIVNFSRTRARRIDFAVSIHYKSDLEKAIAAIKGMIEESPYCLITPVPDIYVDQYADSGIVIRIRCWTPTKLWYPARIELQTRLKKVLDEHGIEIPYPQLDLHLRSARTVIPVRLEGAQNIGVEREAEREGR